MEIGLSRMNKDGSVTIPYGMRRHLKPGEALVFLADEKRITIKRANDVNKALRAMAGEPNTAGGAHKTAGPPVKMPKRDKLGHFLPPTRKAGRNRPRDGS